MAISIIAQTPNTGGYIFKNIPVIAVLDNFMAWYVLSLFMASVGGRCWVVYDEALVKRVMLLFPLIVWIVGMKSLGL